MWIWNYSSALKFGREKSPTYGSLSFFSCASIFVYRKCCLMLRFKTTCYVKK